MNQKLAGAKRGVVGRVAMVVGANVAIQEPEFAVFDQAVGVFEINRSSANRFHFRSGENYSGLEFFEQEVVMARVPVYSGVFLAGGGRLASRIFLPVGLCLVRGLLGHIAETKITGLGSQVLGPGDGKPRSLGRQMMDT